MKNNKKKVMLVFKIDKLLQSINKPVSNYDLIIDSLSVEQLGYYLELTKDEVFYNTI